MNRVQTIIASIIFLALTLVKFLSPALASELRGNMLPFIEHDIDYRAAVARLGESLTGSDGALAAVGRMYGELGAYLRFTEPRLESAETALPASRTSGSAMPERILLAPIPTEQVEANTPVSDLFSVVAEPSPTPDPVPTPEPTPEPVPALEPTPEPEISTETTVPPEPEVDSDDEPEAVAAFRRSQSDFCDQELPSNVSALMPELPFEYAAPVSGYNSSGFGYRQHPIEGGVRFHYGTDFAANSGSLICSFADGVVVTADENSSYGKYIVISHSEGYQTLYAHCGSLLVSAGETVSRGDNIALVGATGQATGPHLHFELMSDGVYHNPEYYV